MQRQELKMDKSVQQWLVRVASRNYWRVADYMELDDLIQDGHVVFHKVQQHYRHSGRTPAHLNNTFKTSFRNYLTDLANKRTRQPLELQLLDLWEMHSNPFDDDYDELQPREPAPQDLTTALAQAPFRIKELLSIFDSEDGLDRLRRPYRRRADGTRETLNERLCKAAGFDSARVDLVAELRAFATD